MPWHSPLTKNAMYDSGPSVGTGRIGVVSGAIPFPRAVDGRFFTVADFFVEDEGREVAFVAFARSLASMSATISFACAYSSDSKYSWPLNSIAMRSRRTCAGSYGSRRSGLRRGGRQMYIPTTSPVRNGRPYGRGRDRCTFSPVLSRTA